MSDNDTYSNVMAVASGDGQLLDFYKSLTVEHRTQEEDLLTLSIASGVVPEAMRYEPTPSGFRGVIKSSEAEEMWYFHYLLGGEFRLLKADTEDRIWDANRLFRSLDHGCEINKASPDVEVPDVEDDDPDAEKAGGASGGGSTSGQPAPVDEEQSLREQHSLLTDQHPGAATSTTPDLPNRGRDWHGTASKSLDALDEMPSVTDYKPILKSLGRVLRETAYHKSVGDKEKQFMVEVLGRTPEEIDRGNTHMSPVHRAQFNLWLNKSLKNRIGKLNNWLEKSSG